MAQLVEMQNLAAMAKTTIVLYRVVPNKRAGRGGRKRTLNLADVNEICSINPLIKSC